MKTNDDMPSSVALIAEILIEWRDAKPEILQRVMEYLRAADNERCISTDGGNRAMRRLGFNVW